MNGSDSTPRDDLTYEEQTGWDLAMAEVQRSIDQMWQDHQCQRPDLEAIVRDLAGGVAPIASDDRTGDYCALCAVLWFKDDDPQDPAKHVPTCPWRRAVEWVRDTQEANE